MALTDPADHGGVADLLERLWQQRRPSVVARAEALVTAVEVLGPNASASEVDQIEREAHRLVGTVGTFGFRAAAEHARRIEHAVAAGAFQRHDDRRELTCWASALRSELDRDPERAAGVRSAPSTTTVGVVTTDPMLTERLRKEAADRDIVLKQAVAVPDRHVEWSAVVVDLDEDREMSGLVNDLRSENATLVVLASDELDQRLRGAQLGRVVTMSRNAEPHVIMDVIVQSVRGKTVAGSSVLALDDDPDMLSDLAAILGHAGLDVQAVADPDESGGHCNIGARTSSCSTSTSRVWTASRCAKCCAAIYAFGRCRSCS